MFLFSKKLDSREVNPAVPFKAENNRDQSADITLAIRTIQALTDRQFTVEHHGDSALDIALQRLIATLKNNASDALAATVNYSMNASHAMASVSRVTGSTRDVSRKIEGMAAATKQLSSSISQIAETSNNAASTAERARNSAHGGIERIGLTIKRMDELAGSVDAISERTEKLTAAAGQISGILETIDAIANQTNLLALNATIESARAGEHGKGFAVVAGEVKALAAQTSRATEDVRQRIAQLENEITSLKEATEQSTRTSQAGKTEMAEAQGEITKIGSQADDVSQRMNEISAMLTEQNAAIAEITQGVTQITALTQRNREFTDHTIEAVRQSESVINKRFEALERQDIPDAVLYRAKSDHFLWKKRLAELMSGLKTLDPNELADHHSCRLGKWYDNIDDPWFLNDEDFKALVAPHKMVHEAGIKAARLCLSGALEEAWIEYGKMDQASIKVIERLDALIAKRRKMRA